ncbi:hypothetical protein OF83DRAFT_831386 [Amylostereum chailletii]|nr:hypothetical protein OF83DRAFT_831386 [Amylostereum chailletii]
MLSFLGIASAWRECNTNATRNLWGGDCTVLCAAHSGYFLAFFHCVDAILFSFQYLRERLLICHPTLTKFYSRNGLVGIPACWFGLPFVFCCLAHAGMPPCSFKQRQFGEPDDCLCQCVGLAYDGEWTTCPRWEISTYSKVNVDSKT